MKKMCVLDNDMMLRISYGFPHIEKVRYYHKDLRLWEWFSISWMNIVAWACVSSMTTCLYRCESVSCLNF